MTRMTRRQFAQTAGVFTAMSYKKISGANNRVGLGFIGLGSRGTALLEKCALANSSADTVAISDVYLPHAEKAALSIKRETGGFAQQFVDFRHVLDSKDIDAVVIATPDHWHALITVEACKAGKDVYLEKPISRELWEQNFMLEAVKKYGRLVQVGTQGRQNKFFQNAVKLIRSGILGRINRVDCWIYWVLPLATEPKDPIGLDWNLWLGPAPATAYQPSRFLFSFRCYQDYTGAGMLADWGAHLFDEALWAMDAKWPKWLGVQASGGIRHTHDDRDTPDDLTVVYNFGSFAMVFRNAPGEFKGEEKTHGIRFVGEHGVLNLDRVSYEVRAAGKTKLKPPVVNGEKIPLKKRRLWFPRDNQDHFDNFLDCVRSRQKPAAAIENHHATKLAHLGNLSYLSGQTILWNEEHGTILPNLHPDLTYREYRAPWQLKT